MWDEVSVLDDQREREHRRQYRPEKVTLLFSRTFSCPSISKSRRRFAVKGEKWATCVIVILVRCRHATQLSDYCPAELTMATTSAGEKCSQKGLDPPSSYGT